MKHFTYKGLIRVFASVFLSMTCAVSVFAAEKAVVIVGKDGSRNETLISELKRIELGTSSLKVSTKAGDEQEFLYSDIDRIRLNAEYSSVRGLMKEGEIAVWPTVTSDGIVNLAGVADGSEIKVYNAGGGLVLSTVVSGDTGTLNLGGLHNGVYIVAVAGQSVKIIKK